MGTITPFMKEWLPAILLLLCGALILVLSVRKDLSERRLVKKGKLIKGRGNGPYVLLNLSGDDIKDYYRAIHIPIALIYTIFLFAIISIVCTKTESVSEMVILLFLGHILCLRIYSLVRPSRLARKGQVRFNRHGVVFTTGNSAKDRKEGTVRVEEK